MKNGIKRNMIAVCTISFNNHYIDHIDRTRDRVTFVPQ